METDSFVPLARERVARMREAVTLAAEGAYHDAAKLLDEAPADEFGQLERTVRALIEDFRIAVEQSALTIEEFAIAQRELEAKLDTINEQKLAIQELSAPIIDVWDHVITIPLIGVLDNSRVQELTERLLARIHEARVAWVVLDLTGTELIDSQVAHDLVKMASAIRLMGARCLVASMRPHVARTLAALETPIEGLLQPMPSLKDSLKYCMSPTGAARGARAARPGG